MKDLSKEEFIKTIKNGDDDFTNRIVVTKQGNFYLFSYEKHLCNTDVFSYDFVAVADSESFQPHNCYVGIDAANDKQFVEYEYSRLNKAWHEYLKTGVVQEASEWGE